jgi:hypothetical protein
MLHKCVDQDVILATAVLHNIGIRWNVEEFEEGEDSGDDTTSSEEEEEEVADEAAALADILREELEAEEHLGPNGDAAPGDAARRQIGSRVRDNLRRRMPQDRRRQR